METTRFVAVENDFEPINSEEFEAGYFARLAGEPQCLSATRGWRAGWADADAGFSRAEMQKASLRRLDHHSRDATLVEDLPSDFAED